MQTDRNDETVRVFLRRPLATPEAVAKEIEPFPTTEGGTLLEHWHADWHARLTRNLSRRKDGRWEPLTWMSVPDPAASGG